MAITTPAIRAVETLGFEGVEVAAGVVDGTSDVVVLAGRLELVVAINEVEDVGGEDAEGEEDVEREEAGVGKTVMVEAVSVAAGSEALDVGCDVSSEVVLSP